MKTDGNDLIVPIAGDSFGELKGGLTKREYFAALVLAEMSIKWSPSLAAQEAVLYTEALIQKLNEE